MATSKLRCHVAEALKSVFSSNFLPRAAFAFIPGGAIADMPFRKDSLVVSSRYLTGALPPNSSWLAYLPILVSSLPQLLVPFLLFFTGDLPVFHGGSDA